MGPPPAWPPMVGFSLTSASFRSVSRGARSRNSTQGSQAPVTSAVSELRFDYPALRNFALAGAALVRADARLVQLEAAGHVNGRPSRATRGRPYGASVAA